MHSPFPDDVSFAVRRPAAEEEQALAEELLPEERLLLSADASPKRVADFARGRVCAREALRCAGAWSGEVPPPVLRRDRMPTWPAGFVGSLAHTDGAAVAAAAPSSRYRGLGIDVEMLERDAAAASDRILLPDERAALAGLPDTWALLWFCTKESVYKALNPVTGVYLGFHDVRVHLPQATPAMNAGASGTITWELLKDSGPDFAGGLRGTAGWTTDGQWLVAGAWV